MTMRAILPPDLTPAQRAKLKALRGLTFIIILNIAFAVGIYIYNFFVSGASWSWAAFGLFAFGQVLYAVLDVGEKYFSAKGQPTLSEIFALGKAEGQRRAGIVGTSDADMQHMTADEIQRLIDQELPPTGEKPDV
jgi:hypothetical protein